MKNDEISEDYMVAGFKSGILVIFCFSSFVNLFVDFKKF